MADLKEQIEACELAAGAISGQLLSRDISAGLYAAAETLRGVQDGSLIRNALIAALEAAAHHD